MPEELALYVLLSDLFGVDEIEENGAEEIMERRVLITLIHQTLLHVQAIGTDGEPTSERKKNAAILNLQTAIDGLSKQQYSPITLDGLSILLMDMAIYAGVGNVDASLQAGRKALKNLGELHGVGKIDENDFRTIGNKLKKYLSTENMDALDVLGG